MSSKIIFVGERQSGYFAEEVANIRGFDYKNVPRKSEIKKQINDILFAAGGKADYIIFDVEQYISPAEEIADEIKILCNTLGATPIIYAPAFVPESEMARAFVNRDIKSFILSGSATDLKDQLEKNLTGYFDVNERKEIARVQEIQEAEKENKLKFKTIGVAGACRRIGTTTQALQIVKYLGLRGYKACLIEANDCKYPDRKNGLKTEISFVEKIDAWFDTDALDEELGLVSSFGMDMYYDQSKIPEILKKGYDYYIYDYGCYHSRGFNKTAFVREDIQLFVLGSSVTELDYTKEVAESPFYQDARFIFSLTSEEEKEDLLFLMDSIRKGNSEKTFFAPYCPDPFTMTNEAAALYDSCIPIEDISGPVVKKGRKLFGKKGGRNGKVR